jgi:hypothetical protein
MNNVKPKMEFATESQEQIDRQKLGLVRTRAKIGFMSPPICIRQFPGGGFYRAWQLGVDQQRQARPCNMGKCFAQLLRGNHGETVDSRVDEKTLKARNARRRERFNVPLIAGGNASPEHPVDQGRFLGGPTLSLERLDGGSRRQAIQRHVRDERIASGRSSAGARGKAFPFGAAWFVDVYVRIDEAGKNGGIAKIAERYARGNLTRRNDTSNFLFLYEECGWTDTVGSHNSLR